MSKSMAVCAAAALIPCLWGLTLLSSAGTQTAEFHHQSGRAILSFSNPIHDLGRTAVRKEWEIPFVLRNRGTRRLVINELDPVCNCGNRTRRTLTIPPGGSAQVTVTLDTRHASGAIEAIGVFTCNDLSASSFQLVARAFVDTAEASSFSTD